MSWCNLDLTFDLAIVTLTFIILSRPYLRKCKLQEVDFWTDHWMGSEGMLNYV